MSNERGSPIAALTVERLGVDGEASSGFARITFGLVVAYLVASRLIADIYTLPIGVSLHATDVILFALLMAWLLWRMTTPLPFPTGFVSGFGAALIVVFLIAPFLNATNLSTFEFDGAERGLVRATLYAGLFVASYHLALSRRRAIRLLSVVVVVTVFQSLIAVYELATRGPLVILGSIWQSLGFEVDPRAIRTAEVVLAQRLTGELRASATASHPLVLTGLVALGIGIAIAFYLYSDSRRVRILLLGTVILQLFAMGATNQRTGFVVLATLAVVILFTQIRRLPSTFPLMAAAAIAGLGVFVFSPRTPRLILNFITGQQTDRNVEVRLSKYEVLPELLERRPLLGAGYLTHDPLMVTFDNGYLTALVEFGIIGFAVFIAFLLVVAGRAFTSMTRAQRADQPILLSALLAVTVLFASMASFDVMSFTQFFPTVLIVMAIGTARADELHRHRLRDT